MDGKPYSICLVAEDVDPSNGVGDRALRLAQQGCDVHLLLACASKSCSHSLATVSHSFLSEYPPPPHAALRTHGVNSQVKRSEAVRYALAVLQEQRHFRRIEFLDKGALGFRAIQAKRVVLGLEKVILAVRLVGPSCCTREGLQDREDLRTDFAEQFAFEHADAQLAFSSEVVEQVRRLGWGVREDLVVLQSVGEVGPTPRTALHGSRLDMLVSVVVTYYNLGEYLPTALASIANQTYLILEVIVVDDGSTDPASQKIFEQQQKEYPSWRFVRTSNQGSGAARNHGLALATGKYVLFFDADNVAEPYLVKTLLFGMERNPDIAAMTCYVLGVKKPDHPNPEPVFLNAFVGGPHLLACYENVYGDTTALVRTEALRGVGGYDTDRRTPWEDWMTYLRLVHAGLRVEVCPEVLFQYRVRNEGRSGQMEQSPADRERLLQILLERYFSSSKLPPGVSAASLWQALSRFASWSDERQTLRIRLVNRLHSQLSQWPWLHAGLKNLVMVPVRLLKRLMSRR